MRESENEQGGSENECARGMTNKGQSEGTRESDDESVRVKRTHG